MKVFRQIWAMLLFALILNSCATTAVFEDRKYSLVEASHAVYGKVVDKIDLYETYTPYRTLYLFKVEENIKGSTSSDTIRLLSDSGKTSEGYKVLSTACCVFDIGDESILILSEIKKPTTPDEKMWASFGRKSKIDYTIKDQFNVWERITFVNGFSKYTKPKVSSRKMVSMMRKYLNDPNKVVPKPVPRPD